MSTETQTAIGKFVWHDHKSGDVEKAKSFYTELLGWELESFDRRRDELSDDQGRRRRCTAASASRRAALRRTGSATSRSRTPTRPPRRSRPPAGRSTTGPSDIPEVGRFFIFADPQGAVLSAFASSGPPRGAARRGRVRLGRAGDERHRRRQEVLRRRLRLDVPRHGHGRRDHVHDLRAPRRRRRRRRDAAHRGDEVARRAAELARLPRHRGRRRHAPRRRRSSARRCTCRRRTSRRSDASRVLQDPTGAAFALFKGTRAVVARSAGCGRRLDAVRSPRYLVRRTHVRPTKETAC